MSKMFQVYGIGQALIPVLPPPLGFEFAPNANQTNYEIGQIVFTPPLAPTAFYMYAGAGNWVEFATGTGAITSVVGTTNQIAASTVAGATTLSIPTAFIAPGSIASTTTVTGATGVIATTGNVTSSAGNLVATTGNLNLLGAGSGLLTTPTVASGAASGTVAANGRVVSVTFTGVSIASGATQAFTTSNTSITGAGTLLALSWSGATAGSALSVASIVNSAGQSVITMTNGTSATGVTSIANITFNNFVLN